MNAKCIVVVATSGLAGWMLATRRALNAERIRGVYEQENITRAAIKGSAASAGITGLAIGVWKWRRS